MSVCVVGHTSAASAIAFIWTAKKLSLVWFKVGTVVHAALPLNKGITLQQLLQTEIILADVLVESERVRLLACLPTASVTVTRQP